MGRERLSAGHTSVSFVSRAVRKLADCYPRPDAPLSLDVSLESQECRAFVFTEWRRQFCCQRKRRFQSVGSAPPHQRRQPYGAKNVTSRKRTESAFLTVLRDCSPILGRIMRWRVL